MRRLLVMFASLALVLPVVAQEPKSKVIPWANKFFSGKTESPPPIILHDFGTLPQGTVRTHRFKMTNIYAVPMQVTVPVPSCRCVSVLEYTGQMGPRDTGYIDIQIDTSRVEGPRKIEMKVKFEGRDSNTHEKFWSYADVEIHAVSRPDISIKPGAIQFGTVPTGQKAEQTVAIYYAGRQRDWQITEFGGFNKAVLDVKVDPLRGAVAYKVTATLKANAPAGAVDEHIILKTNDKESPVLTLNALGMVQPPLSIVGTEPGNVLRMGAVEINKKVEKRVIVRADKPFKVSDISGAGDGLTAPLTPSEPSSSQVLRVVFMPDKAGPVKKELTVKTSTGESIVLTVEAIGTEPK